MICDSFQHLRGWWRWLTRREPDAEDEARLAVMKAQAERDQRELAEELAHLQRLRAERDLYRRRREVGG